MVLGLEKFKEYFREYTNSYVLIGGTACDILMDDLGASFRATKDLDMVLIVEAMDHEFAGVFWKFIEDGGYKHRNKGTGGNEFYRFAEPKDTSFPKMIELFARRNENFELSLDNGFTPIHIGENISSLSAILLNDDYYDLLVRGKITVDGYSIINIETVIAFKIKAWLDLKKKRDSGESVDSKDIRKHKNDVFRLLVNVSPTKKIEVSEEVRTDVVDFLEEIRYDKPDLRNLGIRGTSLEEMLGLLMAIYIVEEDV